MGSRSPDSEGSSVVPRRTSDRGGPETTVNQRTWELLLPVLVGRLGGEGEDRTVLASWGLPLGGGFDGHGINPFSRPSLSILLFKSVPFLQFANQFYRVSPR